MKDYQKIGHPLFIICVFTLILNDWYFKTTFHNSLTGKLSDFAGLFAFPYLLSALFPSLKKKIHLLTGFLFIIWKSEFSQPIIDSFNNFGIPINRTIDFSDNVALISIFVSYFTLKFGSSVNLKPFVQKTIIVISCISFLATSVAPSINRKIVSIDKEYEFSFSKRELVSRLNMVQIKEVREFNKASGKVDFDSDRNVFYYQDRNDTLAILLDYKKINDQDTIKFKTSFAEILISGDKTSSKITLLSLYKVTSIYSEKAYRDKAIKEFEKRIIKNIKNYR